MSTRMATYTVEIRVANNLNEAGHNTIADHLAADHIEGEIHDAVSGVFDDLPEELADSVEVRVREVTT